MRTGCQFFVVFVSLSILLSVQSNGDVVSNQMFRQWGGEILTQIETNMTRGDGLYNNSVSATWPDFAWGQGVMARALVTAAKVDASYSQRAKDQADEFHLRYWCYQNGTSGYNSGYGGCGDRYYDDNAWIALALLELYDLTGDTKYLTWAQDTITFCMTGENGPGDTPDGGIRWHENDTQGACICATAPTCLANLIAYQLTGIESYRTDGLRLYNWMVTSGEYRTASGLFHETAQGVLGYLTAVVTQAAVRLYSITDDNGYLQEAQRMAASMEGVFINGNSYALTQYGRWGGHDMTNAFAELYEADGNTHWLDVVAGYLEYLYVNGIDGATGLYPEQWHDISGSYSEGLIDNASVAMAFWKMAGTPGGCTLFDDFADRLYGRWMLDETSGITAFDSSGFEYNGTLSGSSFSFDTQAVSGRWNGALQFDGDNDYIDLPDGFANFRGGMTISVWAYPTAVKNWARFVDMGNGEWNNNIVFGRHGASNDLFFEAYDNTNSGGQVIVSEAIQLNQWQMFTATLDASGNVVLYRNGSQVTTGNTALPSNIERSNNYTGRSNWAADSYYEGMMDDVRIYTYALSPDEVDELYQFGSQAENPSPVDEGVNVLDVTGLEWTAGSLAVEHDVYLGTDQTAVMNATTSSPEYKGRQSGTTYTPALSENTAYYWRVDEVTSSQEIATGRVWNFRTLTWPTQELLAHYTMDNEFISGSSLIDSGDNPHLSSTLKGSASGYSGPIGEALSFDGINDYIDLPDGFADWTGGMTVSVWAYPTAVGFWARFLDIGNGPSNNNIVFARDGTSNTISFEAYNGSASGGRVTAAGAITLNQWQLFTATLSSTGYAVLYKNGVKIANGQTAIPPVVKRINNFIGKSNWSDAYYKGRMDDYAIWSRALTSDEVMGIYERGLKGHSFAESLDAGIPVGHWSFNDGGGTQANDDSGYDYHGTLVNMDSAWTEGKQCGGLAFDGVDDYVEIPGYQGIVGGGSRTCTFWINTTGTHADILGWGRLYNDSQQVVNGQKWQIVLYNGEVGVLVQGGNAFCASPEVDDGQWHHVAVVLKDVNEDGILNIDETQFYIDGSARALSRTASFPVNTGLHNDVHIGIFPEGNTYFLNGLLDEIRIYDRALSVAEILNVYQQYALIADITLDGNVDLDDFAALSTYWQDSQTCLGDLTCDCIVNFDDLMILLNEWLSSI